MSKTLTIRYPEEYIKLIENLVTVHNNIFKDKVNKTDIVLELIHWGYESKVNYYIKALDMYCNRKPNDLVFYGLMPYNKINFIRAYIPLQEICFNFKIGNFEYSTDQLMKCTENHPDFKAWMNEEFDVL